MIADRKVSSTDMEGSMLRLIARPFALAAAVIALSAGGALAAKGGAGTETTTEHAHGVPLFSFPVFNQCTGQAGTLEAVATNEVFHLTTHADGELWATGTAEGIATFTPEEPGVSFSGHFTSWFGEAVNQRNHVEHDTNTFVLTGTDGTRVIVKMKDHLSTNAQGTVTAEFERENVHCI